MMHKRATALAAVALATALGAGAGTATAEPQVMVLPDATLFCGSPTTTVEPTEWVFHNGATLWIKSGPLAGHYVWLSSAHYLVSGLLPVVRPTSYEGLPGTAKTFGVKAALQDKALRCDFVSRWDLPGVDDDFSIVGPLVIAKVSG